MLTPCKYIQAGQTRQASVFSVKARLLLNKETRFLCIFRSENEGIILQRVQQSAFKSSHSFFKAGHMLKWMNNYCRMVEKCQ